MTLLLRLLAAYLTLGVDPPAEPEPAAPVAEPDDELPSLEEEEPPVTDPEPDEDPVAQLKAEREARAKAEREAGEYRTRAEAAERARSAPAPSQTQEQKAFEEEEAILKNPEASAEQKYWANANRTLRANQRMAQDAMLQAHDARDLNDWGSYKASNPKIASRYEKRVEEKLAEIRSNGQNMSRKLILAMLIGTDYTEGRVKSKPRAEPTRVPRGVPPNPRSDVRSGGGAKTNLEKLEARLEGQRL